VEIKHGLYPLAKRWAKLLGAYFSAQSATQFVGMLAGLLLVRYLPVREFALYTLASSAMTLVTLSSDLGSTASLLHFYRSAETQGERFGDYVNVVLGARRFVFALGATVLVGAVAFAGGARGFGRSETLLAAAVVLVTAWLQIGLSVRMVLLRLAARYGAAYRADLVGSAIRLALVGLLIAVARLSAITALAVAAIAAAAAFMLADSPDAHPEASSRPVRRAARRRLGRYLLPTLPSALYFTVQGPLTIWLAATFGGTRNIAEVGALGRLGLIVGLLTGLSGAVLVPRLASISEPREFASRSLGYGALLAAFAGSIWLFAAVAPGLFLALIGPNYSGLHRELLLLVTGSGLSVLGSYVVSVNLTRGWTRLQALTLGGEIAVQAALVALLPLGTTAGVLWFQIGGAAAGLLFQLAVLAIGFRRPAWAVWS
jgi:O-antigen/teichoic acid export membrane protein